MFGYISPKKPELYVWEYELYQGVYCGLCKELGRRYGPVWRLFLSYDFVFLALILYAVGGEEIKLEPGRCMLNPIKKKAVVESSEALTYSADMSLLFLYYKICDNIRDESGLKRVLYQSARLFMGPLYRKLKDKYPEQNEQLLRSLHALTELEDHPDGTIDAPASAFAELMRDLAARAVSGEGERRILNELFYHIGRWIYLIDAVDDFADDVKSGSFNPLRERFSYQDGEGPAAFLRRIKPEMEGTLTLSLSAAANAFELLPISSCSGILRNILYRGLSARQDEILQGCEVEHGSV